ncbi:methyltransferase domain-containing protein [bacterium]|nr:MAG: methyltransferase domain-containing protein [bacterium]
MNPYRERIWAQFEKIMPPLDPQMPVLDFGSGDGWFASQMLGSGVTDNLTAFDIKLRPHVLHDPIIYDGGSLPVPDRSFELSYSVDVMHHCPDPVWQIEDVLRCTNRYFLLKDHTYRTRLGQLELCLLDEIGNRKFGIPSLYQYQRRWSWFKVIEKQGFVLRKLVYPAPCHVGVLGALTNPLQFIGLWERVG